MAVYSYCTGQGYSWASLNNDVFNFIYAAKFIATPHLPGYPVYTFFSIPIIRLPLGPNEGWRMSFFMATIPAILACLFVFLAVKKQTDNKWAPFVAAATLAGCNALIASASIVNEHSFSTMMISATYLAWVCRKEKTLAILCGLVTGCHPLLIPGAFLMGITRVRKRWWWIPVVLFAGMYTYCVTHNEAFASFAPTALSIVIKDFGSLMIGDFPNRLRDTLVVLCCGFGFSLIPAILFFKDIKKSWMLLWCMTLPVTYWLFTNTEVTIRHLLLAMPFIAVAAGLGLERVKMKPYIIFAVSMILILIMPFFYAVGRNVDVGLGAQQFYDNLRKLPDGAIMTNVIKFEGADGPSGTDERTIVGLWVLDKDEGRKIISFDCSRYMDLTNYGEEYRKGLRDVYGLNTPIFAVFVVSPTGKEATIPERDAPVFQLLYMFAKDNPSVDIYYTTITVQDPMKRILTRFNYETFFK